jgi:tRNA-dihydrouridine synthase
MIRAYFQMLLDEAEATRDLPRSDRMGETAGKMKQFATWFTHGVPGGAKLRAAIYQMRTGAEVLAQVEQFFAARHTDGSGEAPAQEPEDEARGYTADALVCD